MCIQIETATTPSQYAAGKKIFRAYADFLGLDLEFQGFSEEMETLPRMYGAPNGCLLLAKSGNDYVGAVGLRRHDPKTAEIKRMFVYSTHQGLGVGRALTEALIEKAKQLGYQTIKLDSIRSLDKALTLYKKLGFIEIEPYRNNPYSDAIFMALPLFSHFH